MNKYNIRFKLMEVAELIYACNYALNQNHKHFTQILDWNVKEIDSLRAVKRKLQESMNEDYHVELNLMEIVCLHCACNMALYHEKEEISKQMVWCRHEQHVSAVKELEYAREKILAALNK